MLAELISPTDARWPAVLEQLSHDVYHLPEYTQFAAEVESATGAAFLVEENATHLFIPVLLRKLPRELDPEQKFQDVISPYGYPSPVASLASSGSAPGRLWAGVQRIASDHNLVSAFLRSHPLLPLPALQGMPVTRTVEGKTVWIDLDRPHADVVADFRSGHRYDIRKLERQGFQVVIGDWSRLDEFIDVYIGTMERVLASPNYFHSSKYFAALKSALREKLEIIVVLAPDGRVAAAALFSEYRGVVQYLFSGTAAAFVRLAPSKLLIAAAVQWASSRGNTQFHLGGGVGSRDDSLFAFKSGFSKRRAEYSTIRWIFDLDAYERLCRAKGIEGVSEYFPAYRSNDGAIPDL